LNHICTGAQLSGAELVPAARARGAMATRDSIIREDHTRISPSTFCQQQQQQQQLAIGLRVSIYRRII